MWVVPTKSGKFKFVEDYTDRSGNRKYASTTMNTDSSQAEKKARKVIAEKIRKKTEEVEENNDNITFKELADQFLEYKELSIKKSTLVNYVANLRKVHEHIGGLHLDELTPGKINIIFVKMFKDGLSYKTVSERYKLICAVINYGIDFDLMDDNNIISKLRVDKINLPNKEEKKELKYLEVDEAENLLNRMIASDDEELSDFFRLQMKTGMRFNEVAALHIQDIDLINKTIFVRYTYDKVNKIFTLPKGNETRLNNINDDTIELIQKIMRRRKILLMAYGLRKTTLLFFRDDGTPIDITTSQNKLHEYESKEKVLTTQIFRHTFITRMVENYVPATLIAEHVGHKDTQLIERVYNHFSGKMKEDLKSAINDVII